MEILRNTFLSWGFPPDACIFLLKVWEAIQFLDDVKDGDPVENVDSGIYTLIAGLPGDEFLMRNHKMLTGALVTMYYKWQGANQCEQRKANLDIAYVWRAGYYDLVMLVAALCIPRAQCEALAPQVLALYGESREDYLKEMLGA